MTTIISTVVIFAGLALGGSLADNDPFAKVSKGDRLQFKAAVYNALIDLLNENRLPGLRGAEFIPGAKEDETSVLVKNKTGSDVPQFGILAISAPAILQTANDQAFRQRHFWEGTIPGPDSAFVVTQEPIAAGNTGDSTNGRIGRSIIAGETPIKINVTSSSHRFAKPNGTTGTLDSADSGPARILWYDSTAGVTGNNKWAKVLLLGSGGASGISCGKSVKRYGQVFTSGGTDYQDWTIEDCCCNVLSSGCEIKPTRTCGGVPTDPCKCTGTSPNFWTFPLSGIGNGICTACPPNFNRNWCLAKQTDCEFIGGGPNPSSYLCSDGDFVYAATAGAGITIFQDGTAHLFFTSLYTHPGITNLLADYYVATWNCSGSNTLTKIADNGGCSGWPPSITVYSSSSDSLCTNPPGGGHDGASCGVNTWNAVGATGAVNGTCTNCPAITNSITLSKTSNWVYESALISEQSLSCPGPSIKQVHLKLLDNGATGWDLFLTTDAGATTLAHYFTPYAGWDCTFNAMQIVAGSGSAHCTWPTFYNVTKLT